MESRISPELSVALVSLLCVSGCASFPVYAKIDGEKKTYMQGSATPDSISMSSLDGFTCSGQYPLFDLGATVSVPLTCSDGKTGDLLMTFNDWHHNVGYGQGRFSDGTDFQVYVGNVSGKMSAPRMFK